MEIILGLWFQLAQWFTETFGNAPHVIKIALGPSLGLVALAFLSLSLFKISGYSFTGLALSFTFSLFPPTKSRVLGIPNHRNQPKAKDAEDVLSLLTWRTRLSDFMGRDAEMGTLKAWAKKPTPGADILFVSGPGGSGKTRLAAQFGRYLQKKGWNAGFLPEPVSLEKLAKPRWWRQGVLLILDYPENDPSGVIAMLEQLADDCSKQRLRVLLLTRSHRAEWNERLQNCRANSLVRERGIDLDVITHEAGHAIFASTLKAASAKGTIPRVPTIQEMGAWMAQDKRINSLPLFLVAAAVYSAMYPDKSILTFEGPEIIKALNDREKSRLQNMSEGVGLRIDSLALAVTFATLCKGVPLEELESDEAEPLRRLLGLGDDTPWPDLLLKSGHVRDGELKNLEPDIVGADFVHATLGRNKKLAGELVWRAAARDPIAAIGTFGRLIYDAQMTLGRDGDHVQHWLLKALEDDNGRCPSLSAWTTYDMTLPQTLSACCAYIGQCALKVVTDEAGRARELNNLSVRLAALGQREAALAAIQESVDIRRRLAQLNPAAFAPDLASSLNNLSNSLSALGQREAALAAIQESVDLYRKLAQQNPAAFAPDLASSLNNLSNGLGDLGQREAALAASEESVDIRRRLAAQVSTVFAPKLALSLRNLAKRLADLNRPDEAAAAEAEAEEVERRLEEARQAQEAPPPPGP